MYPRGAVIPKRQVQRSKLKTSSNPQVPQLQELWTVWAHWRLGLAAWPFFGALNFEPFLVRADFVVSIDDGVNHCFRLPIRPADLDAVDVGLNAKSKMRRVGVL